MNIEMYTALNKIIELFLQRKQMRAKSYTTQLFYIGYNAFFESEIRCTIPENDRPRNDSISEAIYTSSALPRAFPPCSIAVHYFRRSRRRLHDRSWIAIQRWNGFGGSASLAQTAVVASRPLSNARRARVHGSFVRARTRIRVRCERR